MSREIIELVSSQATIRLDTGRNDWCRVELLEGGRLHKLGADVKEIVVERLRRGLIDTLIGTISEHITGIKAVHVLSLAENHCSIYAAHINDHRWWFIQGSDAKLIAQIQLSPSEMKRWLELLCPGLENERGEK